MLDQPTLTALCDVSYGLYIVSSHDGEQLNGQLTNTVFQVTAEPPRMAAAVNKKNLTHEYISKSGCFTISAVSQDAPMTFIGLFGFRTGRDINKFEKVKYRLCPCGAPIVLEHTVSALEIKVTQSVDIGSHTLFIGEVSCGHMLSDGKPMTYDYYHTVLKGKTPRNATTYMPPETAQGGKQ